MLSQYTLNFDDLNITVVQTDVIAMHLPVMRLVVSPASCNVRARIRRHPAIKNEQTGDAHCVLVGMRMPTDPAEQGTMLGLLPIVNHRSIVSVDFWWITPKQTGLTTNIDDPFQWRL